MRATCVPGIRLARIIASAIAIAGTAAFGCGQILGLGDPVDASDAAAPASDAASGAVDGAGEASSADATFADARSGDASVDASGAVTGDAGEDVHEEPPPCDLGQPFGAPSLLLGTDLNTDANEGTPRLSPDELVLYFWSDRVVDDGGAPTPHLYTTTRAAPGAAFIEPTALSSLNSQGDDASPTVTGSGLTLIFESDRATNSNAQLFIATRTTEAATFFPPSALANMDPSWDNKTPYLRPDGQVLYLSAGVTGSAGQHLYRTTLQSDGAFAAPLPVAELDSPDPDNDYSPTVSPDELTVFWGSDRADYDNLGDFDILMAHRLSISAPFSTLENLATVNSSALDLPGWISPDGCRLYLESERSAAGNRELYIAQKP
jgi:Tol biopolymer transport system component